MKIQSSPILASIGLLYGAFTGAVIGTTITRDNYEAKIEHIESVKTDLVDYKEEIEIVHIPTPKKILKNIPSDSDKRCPEWESKFAEHKLPTELFSYIAWKESRCKPKAHNKTLNRDGSQDRGLVQINSGWKTVTKNICGTDLDGLFNVDCNLKVAKYLYDNGGSAHWSIKSN